MDFKKLKQNRQNLMDKLNKEVQNLNSNQSSKNDERFWALDVDKNGNGYAVIRFLPAPGEEDFPFVRIFEHGFKGPGGWYIEKSLTTLGKEDPVSEYNSELWNSGSDDKKKIAREQKRRLNFISNIYVVKDGAHPENEGKVFLYKYGKKIFDKLNQAMNPPPEFEDEKPINPFDLWEGANFKLKARMVEGYRNYDKSEFESPSPIVEDEEAMEAIWKSEYSLQAFLDPKEFKTYDQLKARLEKVLGNVRGGAKNMEEEDEVETPRAAKASKPAKQAEAEHEDEDALSFFNRLAEDDD